MKILFMGTDIFAVPSLEKLAEDHEVVAVITRPDKPRGRGKSLSPTPVKIAAEKLGIPVYEPKNLKGEKFRTDMEQLDFDVAVVVAYGRLIPPDFLDRPRYGGICLHPSLLPEYRGCSPIEAAIKDGKEKTGISVFHIACEFDTGDVIYQEERDINPEDTGGSLRERFSFESPDIILKALKALEDGEAARIPQCGEVCTYAEKIDREDARIDWNDPAWQVNNMIRAFNPKPGAFSNFRGNPLKILKAEAIKENSSESPGTITRLEKNLGFVTACGEDCLLLTEVQPPGKKPMEAWAYVVGHHPKPGERFDG